MESGAISSILGELFAAIQLLSNYPAPASLPAVHVVSGEVIQERFCEGPCRVKAAYHTEEGVYLDERLDVVHNTFDRSILVHELVHHLQVTRGLFDATLTECERISRDEREAYEIQNRYLASIRDGRRIPLPRAHMACAPAPRSLRPPGT